MHSNPNSSLARQGYWHWTLFPPCIPAFCEAFSRKRVHSAFVCNTGQMFRCWNKIMLFSEQQADVCCCITAFASGVSSVIRESDVSRVTIKNTEAFKWSVIKSRCDVNALYVRHGFSSSSFFFFCVLLWRETDFLQLSWAVYSIDYRTFSREGTR